MDCWHYCCFISLTTRPPTPPPPPFCQTLVWLQTKLSIKTVLCLFSSLGIFVLASRSENTHTQASLVWVTDANIAIWKTTTKHIGDSISTCVAVFIHFIFVFTRVQINVKTTYKFNHWKGFAFFLSELKLFDGHTFEEQGHGFGVFNKCRFPQLQSWKSASLRSPCLMASSFLFRNDKSL